MGRDISWQIEYKEDGHWQWLRPVSKYERFVYSHRDSLMFDLLAGAGRGKLPPFIPARGLPKDMSVRLANSWQPSFDGKPYKQFRILGDLHQSWLSYEELRGVSLLYQRHVSEVSDLRVTVLPCLQQLLADLGSDTRRPSEPLGDHELRAVFGFYD